MLKNTRSKMVDKEALRKTAMDRRLAFVSSLSFGTLERVSLGLVERFQQYFQIPKDYVISTYFPKADEQNVRLLNFFLTEEGYVMAYPRVEESGNLSFRQVHSTKELEMGSFGVMQPSESAPMVDPDLFIVPLLAFDVRCHRLGYGKGHYDRALAQARADRNVLAIGVAYDMQRIDEIPDEPLDEQLEFVVTEARIYKAEM